MEGDVASLATPPPPSPPPIRLYLSGRSNVFVWDADEVYRMRRDWRIYGAPVGSLPSQPLQNSVFSLPISLLPEEAAVLLENGAAYLVDGVRIHGPAPRPVDMATIAAADEAAVVVPPDVVMAEAAGTNEAPAAAPAPAMAVPLPTVSSHALEAAAAFRLPATVLAFPRTDAERMRLDVFRDLWRRGHYMTTGVKFGGDYLVYAGDPSRYHAHFVALVQMPNKTLTPLQLVTMGRLATAVKKTFLLCSKDASGAIFHVSIEWTGII